MKFTVFVQHVILVFKKERTFFFIKKKKEKTDIKIETKNKNRNNK